MTEIEKEIRIVTLEQRIEKLIGQNRYLKELNTSFRQRAEGNFNKVQELYGQISTIKEELEYHKSRLSGECPYDDIAQNFSRFG